MGKKKATAVKPLVVKYRESAESWWSDTERRLTVTVEAYVRVGVGLLFSAESTHVHLTPEQYVGFDKTKAYERLCRSARQNLVKRLRSSAHRGLVASNVLLALEPSP